MRRAVLVSVLVLILPLTAAAQTGMDDARAAFETGRAAYEAGEYETALESFRVAHRLTGSPEILYNIATCADRLRRDEVALEAYRGYLAGIPESADRAQVESRVRVLTEQIAQAEADRVAQEQRDAEQAALREELAARPDTAAPVSSDPGPAPWIVLAGGAVPAIAGAVLLALAEIDSACVSNPAECTSDPSMPRWSEVAARYDRIPTFQTVGWVLLGVGSAAMVTGLIWGIVGGSDDETSDEATVEVRVRLGEVALRGSF